MDANLERDYYYKHKQTMTNRKAKKTGKGQAIRKKIQFNPDKTRKEQTEKQSLKTRFGKVRYKTLRVYFLTE